MASNSYPLANMGGYTSAIDRLYWSDTTTSQITGARYCKSSGRSCGVGRVLIEHQVWMTLTLQKYMGGSIHLPSGETFATLTFSTKYT